MAINNIYVIDNKDQNSFLRRPAAAFDFAKYSKKEIADLIKKMRQIMKAADGVGLSANQIGIDARFFIAQVDNKFYAIFNPVILKPSKELASMEEGCLSVPERFGTVERSEKIILEGFDKNNKKLKIKAWGFLSRVFQHEVDHLNGHLFVDKAKEIYKLEPKK